MVRWYHQPSTLPETNSLHLKMDGWNTSFLLGRPIFRGFCCQFQGGYLFSFTSRFTYSVKRYEERRQKSTSRCLVEAMPSMPLFFLRRLLREIPGTPQNVVNVRGMRKRLNDVVFVFLEGTYQTIHCVGLGQKLEVA